MKRGWVMGAWWFAVQLPKIRVEARHLIIAQSMAGGEPPEENDRASGGGVGQR
jgi:hypothetical protein